MLKRGLCFVLGRDGTDHDDGGVLDGLDGLDVHAADAAHADHAHAQNLWKRERKSGVHTHG